MNVQLRPLIRSSCIAVDLVINGFAAGEEMIIEHLTISAREGQLAQLYSALVSLTGPTDVERGCLSCRVFESRQEPDKLFIQAKWVGIEDLMSHLQSDAYKRLLLLMELSPSPPVLQFYMVQEIQGLDLVEKARDASH